MKIKIAQNTLLDEALNRLLDSYHKQLSLFQKGYGGRPAQENIEPPKKEPEPYKLEYPELSQEQLKSRKLTTEEIEESQKELEEIKDRKYWEFERKKEIEEQLELNKRLGVEEIIKKEIIKKYNELRNKSIEFYKAYQEANDLCEEAPVIDINFDTATYIEVFKTLPDVIETAAKNNIGYLFGLIKSQTRSGRYGGGFPNDRYRLDKLVNFINKEKLNIFNITPANFKDTIDKMSQIISIMDGILLEYNKRKKLLLYLKKNVKQNIDNFLSDPETIKFLSWMDEYYKDEKQEIFETYLNKFSSGDTDVILNLKTYKSIYESISNKFKYSLKDLREEKEYEIEKVIFEELELITNEYLKHLRSNILPMCSVDNIDPLFKYLQKENIMDLKSIFYFIKNCVNREVSDFLKDKDNEKKQARIKEVIDDFILHFINDISKKKLSLYKNTLVLLLPKNISLIDLASKMTKKDIYEMSKKVIREFVLKCIPRMETGHGFSLEADYTGYLPPISAINNLLNNTGKISIEAITNHCLEKNPSIPRDFCAALVKNIINSGRNLEILEKMGNYEEPGFKFILEFLKKNNKYDTNNFINFVINNGSKANYLLYSIVREMGLSYDEAVEVAVSGIRKIETFDKDQSNLIDAVRELHNSVSGVGTKAIINILKNRNFNNFNNTGIVKKLIIAYAQLMKEGGIKGIEQKFGSLLLEFKRRGYISKDFSKNAKLIQKFFESNEVINPSSTLFSEIFQATTKFETDLSFLQMGDALIELTKDYQVKDKNLFKLNHSMSDNLRFSVLKDKDPRILRVGIETNCCQRIGGVGEAAARDSFMNPLSSVLILEWKDNEGKWRILTQSYFHYVPKDNGFILDNIEYNRENVRESGVDLDRIYAEYANSMKDKLKLSYFLAGKGYSKINPDNFKTYVITGGDPRYFDPRATKNNEYTDFNPRGSIDLLSPKFEIKKKAFIQNLRMVIFGAPIFT